MPGKVRITLARHIGSEKEKIAGEEITTKREMCRKALRNHAGVVFFDRMKILPVVFFISRCYTIAVK